MKLISKTRPWSFLLLIVFQLLLDAAVLALAVWIDLSIYAPKPGTAGFPWPAFTILAIIGFGAMTALVTVIAVCLTAYYSVRNARLAREREER